MTTPTITKMTDKKGITIYCGSSAGNSPAFIEAATAVGAAVARACVPLIYGGGHMGMMGAASRACREAGGTTIAIIPQFMVDRGWNDKDSTHTIITTGMHRRKETMASHAAGAIALPGGIGTFEELTELITWRQLGLYDGNIVILNTDGYYDPLLQMLDRAISDGFMPADHHNLWFVTESPVKAVEAAITPVSGLILKPKF